MSSEDKLDCALDLLRRLPPQKLHQNLSLIIQLAPELENDILDSVDRPLKSLLCPSTQKMYLLCEYNRDTDSFRSPYSNEYNPPLADGTKPSAKLRELEIIANDAFNTYRELYFDGGVSCVYFWDLDAGFAATVLIQNTLDKDNSSWNSIHVFEIIPNGNHAHYKLTSTILLDIVNSSNNVGSFQLGGSLTRQADQNLIVMDFNSHVANMGRMVEEMETKMRNSIQDIYFGKTRDVINDTRSLVDLVEARKQAAVKEELAARLNSRKK